ncbi:hypothetical protein ANTQUA_LOCUS3949 [Anthophora quadrimaculata]
MTVDITPKLVSRRFSSDSSEFAVNPSCVEIGGFAKREYTGFSQKLLAVLRPGDAMSKGIVAVGECPAAVRQCAQLVIVIGDFHERARLGRG